MADITLKAYIAHLDDLLGRRSYEEAEAHATQILSRFPRNLQALIRLGKAQIEAGHYNDAEGTFTQVLGMDPRSTDAYVGLKLGGPSAWRRRTGDCAARTRL
ncbi:MAG: tetratricopeptide repeat protein [Chloroflexi bacterium]|nr:tetratricopeptide repeat protein [Chloroflexota bacterium]